MAVSDFGTSQLAADALAISGPSGTGGEPDPDETIAVRIIAFALTVALVALVGLSFAPLP